MKRRFLFLFPIVFLLLFVAQSLLVSSAEAKTIPAGQIQDPTSTCSPQILLRLPFGLADETTEIDLNDCAITALLIGQPVSQFDVVTSYHIVFGIAIPDPISLSQPVKQIVRDFVSSHLPILLNDPCLGTSSHFTVDSGFGNNLKVSLNDHETLKNTLNQMHYYPGSCTTN